MAITLLPLSQQNRSNLEADDTSTQLTEFFEVESQVQTLKKPAVWGLFENTNLEVELVFQLPQTRYIVGRSRTADYPFPNQKFLSAHCCIITLVNPESLQQELPKVTMTVLGLHNKTYINERRLELEETNSLDDGDAIMFLGVEDKPELRPDELCFTFKLPRLPALHMKYELGELLGKGSYSTVRKGICQITEKVVAIKLANKGNDPKAYLSERELNILKTVDHPFLVGLIEVVVTQLHYGFILELALGGDLFDYYLIKGGLTETEFCRVFFQVLAGIKYLHDKSIIHRDIKPKNILIYNKCELLVKIADFGLSRVYGSEPLKSLLGSPFYAAPEVNNYKLERSYNVSSDMWSVGITMYQTLFLRSPFPNAINRAVNEKDIQDVNYTRKKGALSASVLSLIEGLLVLDPSRRLTASEALNCPIFTECQDDIQDLIYIMGAEVTTPSTEEA